MFKLRIYCNDDINCNDDIKDYWEEGIETFETYDKALIACYEIALNEVQNLMDTSNIYNWFEVEKDFEITEPYVTDILKNTAFFPVATVYYDKAPWDRENDCDIKIVTGYDIVKVK